jgi:hypothetical protein
MKTGISSDQLATILDTLTHKKRELDIPKFKGDPLMFDQWKELVEAEIEKPGYSEIEKVHFEFAVTLLDGECCTLVAGLKDRTYDDVIKALGNKYGDVMSRIQKARLAIAIA